MRWLPESRSSRWWTHAVMSGAIITVLLWVIRFYGFDQTWTLTHALRYLLLGFALSYAFGLAGWLGLRLFWLMATAGTALGLLMMAMSSGGTTGWEDLVGLMNFFLFAGIGIVVGAAAELVRWMLGAARRK